VKAGGTHRITLVLAIVLTLLLFTSQREPVRPVAAHQLGEGFAELPMRFERNAGQTDAAVDFFVRGHRYTVFLTPAEAVLTLSKADQAAAVRIKLRGANTQPQVQGEDELPGKSNYLTGDDPGNWRTEVPNYGKVRYKELYSGIDLVYYGNGRQLEYDFIVAPGADSQAIRVGLEGAESAAITPDGDLVLATGTGEELLRMQKPAAYQQIAGQRHDVAVEYMLSDAEEVSFRLGEYDTRETLVIDPIVFSYSTYFGGTSTDGGYDIAVDGSGSAYVVGYTYSLDFPTVNPLQPARAGTQTNADAFIAKFHSSGSALVYATYFGGSDYDQAAGVAVDGSGNVYVTGLTLSLDFPVANAPPLPDCGGFVTKLNSTGSALVYSARRGGGIGIAVDASANAYVMCSAALTKLNAAGTTVVYSTSLVTGTALAVDTSGNAYVTGSVARTEVGFDAFVKKLNATGSAVVYSTYLGGSADDYGLGIAVDGSGNAFVTGYTYSTDFTTLNPFQSIFGGGYDAFVAKLDTAGSPVYSTFLGGSGNDQGTTVAVDGSGSAYVAGRTDSQTFPTVEPAQAAAFGGEAFVSKFNAAGSALNYSTFLGGVQSEIAYGIAVDVAGNAYVTGFTNSNNFPTVNAVQPVWGSGGAGANDGFVTKISQVPPGPPPTLTSVSPSSGAIGTAVRVVLIGTNFTTIANGTGIFVSGSGVRVSSVVILNSTEIWAFFAIDASATGTRNVTVQTTYGVSNSVPFTITGSPPTVTSTNIAAGLQGTVVNMSVNGTNFLPGSTTVNVSESGVTASVPNVESGLKLTTTLTIATYATPGARNLTVSTSFGTSNSVTFSVIDAGYPTLASITPSYSGSASMVDVTLTGTHFVSRSTTVNVSGSGVTASTPVVPNSTSLTTTLTIAPSTPAAPRDVTVTTPDGTSNAVIFYVGDNKRRGQVTSQ
jgi:hypothetical protein